MDFYAVLDQMVDLLRSRGRVSYRALKVQFHLDDAQLDALKEELLYAYRGAVEEDGPGLVWIAGTSATPTPTPGQGRPTGLAYLAEGYLDMGQAEEGLGVVAEALALVDKNGERWWEAELHRLKGELLLRHAVPDEHQVEGCFDRSLAISRRQQAKSLELRAAMSLSRLWQQQGKGAQARVLLAPIYGWFTEGFDTADLQEARALLEALT